MLQSPGSPPLGEGQARRPRRQAVLLPRGGSRARPVGMGSECLAQARLASAAGHSPFQGGPAGPQGGLQGPGAQNWGHAPPSRGPWAPQGEKAPKRSPLPTWPGHGRAPRHKQLPSRDERGVPGRKDVREPHFPARLPAPSPPVSPVPGPGGRHPRRRGRSRLFSLQRSAGWARLGSHCGAGTAECSGKENARLIQNGFLT